MLRTLPEPADDPGAVLRIIGLGAVVNVDEVVFERAIDQHCELARGSGDGLGLADAERDAAKELAAARRRMAAARLAEGCVRLLKRRPPEILL